MVCLGACETKYFSLDLIFGFSKVHTEPSCIDTLRMKKHKAGFFNSEKYKYELHFLCTFGICTITHTCIHKTSRQ